jgi:hypothetical protein
MNRHERRRLKARNGGWLPMMRAQPEPRSAAEQREMFDHLKTEFPQRSDAELWTSIRGANSELREVWQNDLYTCFVIPWKGRGPGGCDVIQLSIRRNDRAPPREQHA